MKVYVASSWRNEAAHRVAVDTLRAAGHEVYDFRNPEPGDHGFSWRQIDDDPAWLTDPVRFRAGLQNPIAQRGFGLDMAALRACSCCRAAGLRILSSAGLPARASARWSCSTTR